ncbi:MAG TPA: BON domain-containing protein [Casimicrobiaceae bacterium]|nr:BON domain-containing protein [Casimicrobiaceae bacterium]
MARIDDSEIRRKVISELECDPNIDWHPSIDSSTIGVAVKDGIVALSGTVATHWHKKMAESAAKRVSGVRAVVDGLVIKLPGSAERDDSDIAHAVLDSLCFNAEVQPDRIQVTVENGWVVLEGEVETEEQKSAAGRATRQLMGVRGVTNGIEVKPRPRAADVSSAAHADAAR